MLVLHVNCASAHQLASINTISRMHLSPWFHPSLIELGCNWLELWPHINPYNASKKFYQRCIFIFSVLCLWEWAFYPVFYHVCSGGWGSLWHFILQFKIMIIKLNFINYISNQIYSNVPWWKYLTYDWVPKVFFETIMFFSYTFLAFWVWSLIWNFWSLKLWYWCWELYTSDYLIELTWMGQV